MKASLVAAIAILTTSASGLRAQDCTGNPAASNASQLQSLLNNTLVCAYKSDADPSDANQRWSEEHRTGGDLWEFGPGSNSTIQPPGDVGSWGTSTSGTTGEPVVDYDYGTGGSYSYQLREYPTPSPTMYVFCTDDVASPQPVAFVDGVRFNSGSLLSLPSDASVSNPCSW